MSKKNIVEYVKGFLVLAFLLCALGIVGYVETHYSQECTIYEVKGDVVTFEDRNGNLWDYMDLDSNFKNEKQKYILIFDNNTTDHILTDDTIVKVKIKNKNEKRKGDWFPFFIFSFQLLSI